MQVDEIEESFKVINGKEKPLAAYLFTNDQRLKTEFVKNVSAGGMTINDTVLHVSHPKFIIIIDRNIQI